MCAQLGWFCYLYWPIG